MNCKVEKSKISGQITCPPNKSYTHRAIFLATLAGNNSRVDNVLFSADTIATIEACKKFGAEIETTDSSIIIKKEEDLRMAEYLLAGKDIRKDYVISYEEES